MGWAGDAHAFRGEKVVRFGRPGRPSTAARPPAPPNFPMSPSYSTTRPPPCPARPVGAGPQRLLCICADCVCEARPGLGMRGRQKAILTGSCPRAPAALLTRSSW